MVSVRPVPWPKPRRKCRGSSQISCRSEGFLPDTIYWLRGTKVADDYEDFYDGSWDNKSGHGRDENGSGASNTRSIWTGTDNDGTEAVPSLPT